MHNTEHISIERNAKNGHYRVSIDTLDVALNSLHTTYMFRQFARFSTGLVYNVDHKFQTETTSFHNCFIVI